MKSKLSTTGKICIFVGVVWILQGINILPGSFMTGQMKWAYWGMATALAGIILMLVAMRREADK